MSNKTITISPSLFSIGAKTKKNRGKKAKPTKVPIISPNVLKNKLLSRIKEHKQKEIQNTTLNFKDSLKQSLASSSSSKSKESKEKDKEDSFEDEFHESIEYLQSLTKAKHQELEKKRKEELERKTLKNHSALYHPQSSTSSPLVNLDLPSELEPVETMLPANPDPLTLHVNTDVPYGILKGGTKPTYRQWTKTQRNNVVDDPNLSVVINPETQSRENRLRLLKQKIQQTHKPDPALADHAIKKTSFAPSSPMPTPTPMPTPMPIPVQPVPVATPILPSDPTMQQQPLPEKVMVGTKYITKKTIKRKYSLGRSHVKRKVSVLIKDRGTRKRIITAQKELKKKNINEVKEYLKKHNLWSIGSNAPNDVLRQMYESAMLAGEITNQNSEILLHNLTKE